MIQAGRHSAGRLLDPRPRLILPHIPRLLPFSPAGSSPQWSELKTNQTVHVDRDAKAIEDKDGLARAPLADGTFTHKLSLA